MPTDEEECDKSLKQPDSQMRLRMLNGPQWIKYRSYYISYIWEGSAKEVDWEWKGPELGGGDLIVEKLVCCQPACCKHLALHRNGQFWGISCQIKHNRFGRFLKRGPAGSDTVTQLAGWGWPEKAARLTRPQWRIKVLESPAAPAQVFKIRPHVQSPRACFFPPDC